MIVETPGEFEFKGVFIRGLAVGESSSLIYRIQIDGLSVGHFGTLAKSDETIEAFFDGVDVLCVPTGGGEVLTPTAAAEAVSSIEPRIVIPMNYRSSGASHLQPVEKFCQAMGMNGIEPQNKLSLTAKDLPHEETRIVILQD